MPAAVLFRLEAAAGDDLLRLDLPLGPEAVDERLGVVEARAKGRGCFLGLGLPFGLEALDEALGLGGLFLGEGRELARTSPRRSP